MIKQIVVRTRSTGDRYSCEPEAFSNLSIYLKKGYHVVAITPIGKELEYILEREETEEER